MRIRSTKPEFWRSERIASVSWEARLVLKGLESYVDDNGVGKDDLSLIVGDLFPRDLVREPSRTLARVSETISELFQAGLVHRYEADGASLLFMSFWEQVQRVDKPQAGRFPRPDGTLNYRDSDIREPSGSPREDSRGFQPGTGEQGNRGTGEQGNSFAASRRSEHDQNLIPFPGGEGQAAEPASEQQADYPSAFEDAWTAYGRKGAKRTAYAEWQRALKRAPAGTITAAIGPYVDATPEKRYRKDFERWLKGDCWESALPEPSTPSGHRSFRDPGPDAYDEESGFDFRRPAT